jgi:hypothetical protein
MGCLLVVGREGRRGSGGKNVWGGEIREKNPQKTKRYASPSEKLMLIYRGADRREKNKRTRGSPNP